MQELKINPELQALIPPLTAEEYQQLTDNILAEGIREAILTWNGTIVDGHNRYAIAQEFGIPFTTKAMEFQSINHAKKWMAENQLGRRNLTDFIKGELLQVIEECEKAIGAEKYNEKSVFKGNQHTGPLSIIDNEPKHNTRKIVAEKLGWSTGKKAMFDVVKKKASDEVKEQLRTGEVSINQAYQDIKKEQKREIIDSKGSTPEIPKEDIELINRLKNNETVVINIDRNYHALKYAKDNELYQQIDRWTDWGNPYFIPSDGDRNEVCDSYEIYFKHKKSLWAKINTLKGKALGCHCYPERCHGDYLKKITDETNN